MLEVLFATGILAMALFALMAVASLSVHTDRKSFDEMVATRLADRELNRAIFDALTGANTSIFDGDYPYPTSAAVTNTTYVGDKLYTYAIYASTVSCVNGTTLGSGSTSQNLVKKVDIVVWWWNDQATRQGYGRLESSMSRLVGQGDTP